MKDNSWYLPLAAALVIALWLALACAFTLITGEG